MKKIEVSRQRSKDHMDAGSDEEERRMKKETRRTLKEDEEKPTAPGLSLQETRGVKGRLIDDVYSDQSCFSWLSPPDDYYRKEEG